MGGPVNKAGYAFSVGLVSSQVYTPMAATMAAGMVPPLGLGLATFVFRNRFTAEEREAGGAAGVLGLAFITEGAIPFAARDPFRIIPSLMTGSAIAGAVSMAFGVELKVPHGGIFVLPIPGAVTHLGAYALAIAAGTVVTAALVGLFKRAREDKIMFHYLLKGACTAGVIAFSLSSALAQETPVKPFQPLADQGIMLALNYTGEAAGNVSGGLRRASAYTGQVYMGADLDMGRIAGIGGGTVHFAVTNRHGKSLSDIAIGNNTSVQEVWGTQNTHLAILTWEQKWLNGRVDIEAGRSQANIHFLNSPLSCNL
ncbi:hypothetical protein E4T56_gene9466 [Termitomyces sp. T112]|nr:hypothetical protein E4T56_gene9466 [Termitomyces sp. T112]